LAGRGRARRLDHAKEKDIEVRRFPTQNVRRERWLRWGRSGDALVQL
jgi:hypothetical protein